MTFGPPPIWATLFVKSSVPSAQLVLVMVPALESIVVVPAALQFQVGEFKKFADHCVASTLTEGGSVWFVQHVAPECSQPLPALPSQSLVPPPQPVQEPPEHVWLVVQTAVVHVVPQLESRLTAFSHPFD